MLAWLLNPSTSAARDQPSLSNESDAVTLLPNATFLSFDHTCISASANRKNDKLLLSSNAVSRT